MGRPILGGPPPPPPPPPLHQQPAASPKAVTRSQPAAAPAPDDIWEDDTWEDGDEEAGRRIVRSWMGSGSPGPLQVFRQVRQGLDCVSEPICKFIIILNFHVNLMQSISV